MKTVIHNSILDFDAVEWNQLAGSSYPFMKHEFLAALEQNGCTGEQFGWLPKHIGLYQDSKLTGAIPVYEKNNSYGEFVFDNAWAEAYHRHGVPYFPKWISSAPYTPVTGRRLLYDKNNADKTLPAALINNVIDKAAEADVSSLHFLFPDQEQMQLLKQHGFMIRTGCQFHWQNPGYHDFQDFLDQLTSKKRKNIKQERRYAEKADVEIDIISGNEATEQQLVAAELFYKKTFDEKWGLATLNLGFFKQIAESMGQQLLLIMAKRNDTYIAGAICFKDEDCLYGRHWGCIEEHSHLHFELCYYQGIEYCIRNKLQRFEPGAQGEHKISRGFNPTLTWSAHWIKNRDFSNAINDFLHQEEIHMQQYMKHLQEKSPFK